VSSIFYTLQLELFPFQKCQMLRCDPLMDLLESVYVKRNLFLYIPVLLDYAYKYQDDSA